MTWRRRPLLAVALCLVCALATFYLYLGTRGTPVRVQFLANVTRLRGDSACVTGGLAIVVLSEPGHREIRQVIRHTWGYPDVLRPLAVGLAFAVVGNEASADDRTQRHLHWEAEVFGDTVQAGEAMRSLGVVRVVCRPSAVLLLEEGVFVNPFALQTLIRDVLTTSSSEEKTLWCLQHTTNGSSEIFPKTTAVLLPAKTLHQLLDSGQRTMSVEELCRPEVSAGDLVHRRFSSPLVAGVGDNAASAQSSAALVHLETELVDRTGQLWRSVLASRGMDLMKSRETF